MHKNRLEAFSDGVFAIIITIMVLELKVPHGVSLEDLRPLVPKFLSYVLSFIYIAIYWNNHHHLFQIVKHINGGVLWANVHLLFWLSLVPFVTAWAGENHFAPITVAFYGGFLFMASIAYFVLAQVLLRIHESNSALKKALGSDLKGKISTVLYLVAIPMAFWESNVSLALYLLVAIIWLIPDRRVERVI